MSVNVYLKGEEVKKINGFEVIERREKDGHSWKQYKLPGIDLSYGKGRWYVMLYDPTDPIPSLVANIVEEVSFYTWISSSPRREAGIYRHKSAEAEVGLPSNDRTVHICIKAKKMEDLSELFRKIRIGSIRPDESYEGEQDGMSCVQLKKELERLQNEKAELEEELKRSQDEKAELEKKLTALTEKVNWFSRCTRWLVGLYQKLTFRKK